MDPGSIQSLALAFGIGALVSSVATRLRVPAVLPLLAAGVAAGPTGLGLVEFTSIGELFRAIVALSIGLLVFEGGLHLDRKELARAPRAVLGLLSVGAIVTAGGTAVAAHFIAGLEWPLAFLLGSLVMVTGPTVIQPILRQVHLAPRLRSVLASEAILIDPIGVIGAVATLEIVLAFERGGSGRSWQLVLLELGGPFLGGALVGLGVAASGALLIRVLGARVNLNLIAFGLCMLAIGLGESLASEGGLVAATVAGTALANLRSVQTSDVRHFKEQIAAMLVGMLFVLLASSFDVAALRALGTKEFVLVGTILFVVRPVAVAAATFGSMLTWRERTFISLFAPRGVVATAVATLTAAELSRLLAADGSARVGSAQSIGHVVVLLVIVSVTWATVSAWPLARLLGVLAPPARCVMVVGAHPLGRAFAKALRARGIPVVLVDSNHARVEAARAEGLAVHRLDATDLGLVSACAREHEVGWLFSWTGNGDVDRVVLRWAREAFGSSRATIRIPALTGVDMPPESGPARSARLGAILERIEAGGAGFEFVDRADPAETVLHVRKDMPVALAPAATVPADASVLVLRGLSRAEGEVPSGGSPDCDRRRQSGCRVDRNTADPSDRA